MRFQDRAAVRSEPRRGRQVRGRLGRQRLPRPHARHPRRHRAAGETGAVPTPSARLPAGPLQRHRRAARRRQPRPYRRCDPRGRAGRRRCDPGEPRVPRRRPTHLRRERRGADLRRDPDRPVPHGLVAGLPVVGVGRRARCLHLGQGHRQWPAPVGVCGARTGGVGFPTGRPRHHHGRRAGGVRGRARGAPDHGRRRPRRRCHGERNPPRLRAGRAERSVGRQRTRSAARRRASRWRFQGRGHRRAGERSRGEPGFTDGASVRSASDRHRRRDRRSRRDPVGVLA